MTNGSLKGQEIEELKERLTHLREQLNDASPQESDEHGDLYHAVEDMFQLLVDGGGEELEAERISQLRTRLQRYAAEFDVEHPRTSAVVRQIGGILERMGI